MKANYDVIVVGAGPAGSVAAMRAAQNGLAVLMIEKRQEIGVPVRCGEAVSEPGIAPYITPDPRWIDAHIDQYAVHNSAGDYVTVPPTEPTLIVNRKVFDYELALNAARAGTEIHTSTTALDLIYDDGRVAGVHMQGLGRAYDVRAGLVIAADGTESQLARWAGLKSIPPLGDYYAGVQFLLSNMDGHMNPQVCEYHVGSSIAPGGYLWVFPKGQDTANVGIVMSADQHNDDSPQAYLERFVAAHYPRSSIMSVVVGGIPVTGALKRMVTDGLMVVGDAAHQADPLTAGGINLGMIGADLALSVGIPAVCDGDVSAARLKASEVAWRQRFGRMHKSLYTIRKAITQMDEALFSELVRTAGTLPLEDMLLSEILLTILRNHPALLIQARTLVSTGLILK